MLIPACNSIRVGYRKGIPLSLLPRNGIFTCMATAVYLIYGDDEYRVSEKARQIVDYIVPPEDRTLALEIIDGCCDTSAEAVQAVDRTIEALLTVGFLCSRKTVWLRGANFLADGNLSRSDTIKSKLAALTAEIKTGLPQGHTLVLTSPKVDKRSALAKTCAKCGETHEFSMPDKGYMVEQLAAGTLQTYLDRIGLTMSEETRTIFLEKVGSDTRQIVNELEKLCAYLGDRRCVESCDVEAITSSSRGAMAWDLADAFGKRKLQQALVLVRRLLFRKESPIGLLMALESRIKDLMIFREALDRGWARAGRNIQWKVPEDVAGLYSEAFDRDPRKTHPYRAGLLAEQARGFSRRDLLRCKRIAGETHKRLVSGSVPRDLTLEIMLFKLLAQQTPAQIR